MSTPEDKAKMFQGHGWLTFYYSHIQKRKNIKVFVHRSSVKSGTGAFLKAIEEKIKDPGGLPFTFPKSMRGTNYLYFFPGP